LPNPRPTPTEVAAASADSVHRQSVNPSIQLFWRTHGTNRLTFNQVRCTQSASGKAESLTLTTSRFIQLTQLDAANLQQIIMAGINYCKLSSIGEIVKKERLHTHLRLHGCYSSTDCHSDSHYVSISQHYAPPLPVILLQSLMWSNICFGKFTEATPSQRHQARQIIVTHAGHISYKLGRTHFPEGW
jgi:hypothetical protein